MSTNTAWVTLATNDSYCLGALVLAHSLRRVNTGHQLAVLITPGVSPSMRQQLSSVFNVVQEVDVMNSGDEANLALMARPDLGVTFTKLHCWNLTQFSKCVFLDADTLVIQNCDELFEREELSAAPDVGWPDCFNSGVFVFIPSKDTFKALLNCALAQGSFDGGDQGLLNTYFGDWATKDIKKHLPFVYNMVSTATYSYLPAFKLFGSQVKIVHFLGINKPWLQGSGATAPTMSSYLDLWWNIFRSQVSQTLTKDMISNCTFDGVRWPNHPSSMHSPFSVHQHSYDNFRNLEQQQQQQHEEERHVFIDPWETVTVEQVQNISQIYSQTPQNRTCGRTHDSIDAVREDRMNLVHRGSNEVPAKENTTQVAAEQNYFQRSLHPNNERIPGALPAPTPLPSHTEYLTKHMTAVQQNNASTQPSDCHTPPSSTLTTDIPSSSRNAVALQSNNHSQMCTHQQQDIPNNAGIHLEAGLAGALAAGERSAFEEVWRRQNWEQGVIDYMGRDSFDNIWKRISESVGLSSTPSTAVPPAPPAPAPAPQSAEIKPSAPSETVQDKTKEPSAQTESPVTPAVLAPLQSDPTTAQSEQPKVEVSVKAAPEPKTEATPEVPKTEETSVPPVPQAAEPSPTDKQTAVVPEAPKVPVDKEKMSTISEKKTETSSAETPKSEPSEVKEGEKPKEEVKPPAAVPTTDTSSPVADAEASKEKSQELSKSDAPSAPLPTSQATESMPQKEEPLAKKEISALTSSVPEKATDSQKEASVEVKKPQQTEGEKDSTPAIKETEKKAPTEDKSQKEPTKPSQETTKSEVPTSVPTEIKKSDVSPPIPLPEAPKAETPVETPKADATAAAPKTDIPAETTKAEVPSAEAKDAKAIPSQKEEKGDKAKEAVSPGAAKAEELKTSAPGTETAAQKVETPKDDTTPKKQTSQTASAEKPTTETPKSDSTQKEQPTPATAPVAEPTLAAAVTSKDSVPAAGGDVSEPLGTAMPSSPGASGIPELPSEGAATLSKPSSEPKKSATPSAAPQTPPAESSSAEKSVAAPVPPKRKGNKEQKSQNGGKQSKSKK